MKRIDTINARTDVNGPGKAGFHANDDLPGQDATYVSPGWLNTVQEELANAIEQSGLDLDPNDPGQLFKLFNIHNKALVQRIYHVGSKHITDNVDWNPAIELETYFGYQTSWMLWPHIPIGVEKFTDNLDQITLLNNGGTVQGKTTRIWQRLPDGASAPTYKLSSNRNAVNEGEEVTFTLETTGLTAGTPVDWEITGIQVDDIAPARLTGQFIIEDNGNATYTLTAVSDQKTEGNETLKFALAYVPKQFVNVLIVDTSKYPEGQTTYYKGAHTLNVEPNQIIVIDMYAPGGGGGGSIYSGSSQNPIGKDGTDNILALEEVQFIAGGGKAGTGGVWGNGSSYSNGAAGLGGINTIASDPRFTVLENQNGNSAVIGPRWSRQAGGLGITSSVGTLNGGGAGAWGIGDERWSYGGGGGGGAHLKVQFTNTAEETVTLNLVVGTSGTGWKGGGNSGDDGGIGFAIVSTS